jgi:hypothetical protein
MAREGAVSVLLLIFILLSPLRKKVEEVLWNCLATGRKAVESWLGLLLHSA